MKASTRFHRTRRVWLALGSVVLVAILAEGGARLTDPGSKSDKWEKHLELIADLPERDAFLRDRAQAEDYQRMVYHDYFLVAPRPFRSEHINFVEENYSARPCPASTDPGEAGERVWFFGGSTMENIITATDRRTLANQAILRLNQSGVPAEGWNFGVRSFYSIMEALRLQDMLRREPEEQHPTTAVFYDGYNDAHFSFDRGPGNIPGVFAGPIRLIVERRNGALFRLGLSDLLAKHSVFCERFVSPRLRPDPYRNLPRLKNPDPADTVEMFVRNARMIRASCRAFDVRPVFVLQPLVVSKEGLTEYEEGALAEVGRRKADWIRRYYALVREAMQDDPEFLDLSHCFDHNGRTDFYDLGHTGPYSGEDTGRAIAAFILNRSGQSDASTPDVEPGDGIVGGVGAP